MLYNPPSGSTNPNASYVGKDLVAGTQGSKVPRMAIEATQREIVNAILASGLVPTNADLTQLSQAIAIIATQTLVLAGNVTKSVGGSGADFPDLATAFLWAAQYKIPSSANLVFNVQAGQWTRAATPLVLFHPDGRRITVQGTMTGAFPLYSEVTKSGSAAANRATDFTSNLSLFRSRMPSELRFTNSAYLVVVGDITVNNLFVTSDGAGSLVDLVVPISGTSAWNNVAVAGANYRGFRPQSGTALLNNFAAFGCGQAGIGPQFGGSIQQNGNISAFGNGSTSYYGCGVILGLNATYSMGIGNLNIGYNKASGILTNDTCCGNFQNFTGGTLVSEYNGADGATCAYGGTLLLDGGTVRNNGIYGVSANNRSYIAAFQMTNTGNASGVSSPAYNTVGNTNSIIGN